jgi:hypothetical protein
MNERVIARAHRILKRLPRYRSVVGTAGPMLPWVQELSLPTGEVLIGVYENVPGEPTESIAITDRGLHVFRNGTWEFVGYEQIDRIETPSGKAGVEELVVHLLSGKVSRIPVRGGRERFHDAFEVLRFLDRVISDRHAK